MIRREPLHSKRRKEVVQSEQRDAREELRNFEEGKIKGKLNEVLKKGRYDDGDVDKLEEYINDISPEGVKEVFGKYKKNSDEIFGKIFAINPRFAKENIKNFQNLGHVTLNTLLKERGKGVARTGIGKSGVFNTDEIQKAVHEDFENNFDAYKDDGGYDYKKAVDELRGFGIEEVFSEEGFVVKDSGGKEQVFKRVFSGKEVGEIMSRGGGAEWVRNNQEIVDGKEIKDGIAVISDLEDPDRENFAYKSYIEAGFVDEVLDVLGAAGQGSVSDEVLETVIQEVPKKSRVEEMIALIPRFGTDDSEVVESLIDWVVESHSEQQVEDIIVGIKNSKGIDYNRIAEKCAERGLIGYVAEHLGQFRDLNTTIFEKLIDEGHLPEVIKKENLLSEIFEKSAYEAIVSRIYTESAYEIKKLKNGDRLRVLIDETVAEDPLFSATKSNIETSFGVKGAIEVKKIQDYIKTKKAVDDTILDKLENIQEVEDGEAKEKAFEALRDFEERLVNENVRMKENTPKKWYEKVASGLDKLGELNISKLIPGWEPKGMVGKAFAKTLSVRTAGLLLLAPIGGAAFGAVGLSGAFIARRLLGATAFAGKGSSVMEKSIQKGLNKRVKKIENLNEEEVVSLKKEFDALISQSGNSENIRGSEQYGTVMECYKDSIIGMCEEQERAEDVRMKQNLAESAARKTVKTDGWKMWAKVGLKVGMYAGIGTAGSLLYEGVADSVAGDSSGNGPAGGKVPKTNGGAGSVGVKDVSIGGKVKRIWNGLWDGGKKAVGLGEGDADDPAKKSVLAELDKKRVSDPNTAHADTLETPEEVVGSDGVNDVVTLETETHTLEKGETLIDLIKGVMTGGYGPHLRVDKIRVLNDVIGERFFDGLEDMGDSDLKEVFNMEADENVIVKSAIERTADGETILTVEVEKGLIDEVLGDDALEGEAPEAEAEVTQGDLWMYGEERVLPLKEGETIGTALSDSAIEADPYGGFVHGEGGDRKAAVMKIVTEDGGVYAMNSKEDFSIFFAFINRDDIAESVTVKNTDAAWEIEVTGVDPDGMKGGDYEKYSVKSSAAEALIEEVESEGELETGTHTLKKGETLGGLIKDVKGPQQKIDQIIISNDAGGKFVFDTPDDIESDDLEEIFDKKADKNVTVKSTVETTADGKRILTVDVGDGLIDEDIGDVQGPEEIPEPETEVAQGDLWRYDEEKDLTLKKGGTIGTTLRDNAIEVDDKGEFVHGEGGDRKAAVMKIVTEDGRVYKMNSKEDYAPFSFIATKGGVAEHMAVKNTGAAWEIKVEGVDPGLMKGYEQYSVVVVESGGITPQDIFESEQMTTDHVFKKEFLDDVMNKELTKGHEVQLFKTESGILRGVRLNNEYHHLLMSAGEEVSHSDTVENLVIAAEDANADIDDVQDKVWFAGANGEPTLSAKDLSEYRSDLGEKVIRAKITRGDDEVLLGAVYAPQKELSIETNTGGTIDYDHVREKLSAAEKIRNATRSQEEKQEIIQKVFAALTVDNPPADTDAFNELSGKMSEKIAGDKDLTEEMFSEKGWRDKGMRFTYSEEDGQMKVQEHVRIGRRGRYGRSKWVWRDVLVEEIAGKK